MLYLQSSDLQSLERASWAVSDSLRAIITAPLTGLTEISLHNAENGDASLLRHFINEVIWMCGCSCAEIKVTMTVLSVM